jgi:hypothetical protein
VLAGSLVAAVALFLPWHEVDSADPDPNLLMQAFYVGPDYNVPSAERANMLERAFARRRVVVCNGMNHLGGDLLPPLLIAAPFAVACAALFARSPRARAAVASASAISACALAWLTIVRPLFAHLLDKVGRARPAQTIFDAAAGVVVLALLVMFALNVVVARERRLVASAPPT